MRGRAHCWATLLLGLLACDKPSASLFLSPDGAASLVLLVGDAQGLPAQAYAYSPESGPITLPLDRSFDRDVFALRFDRTLSDLGLDPGPQSLVDDGAPIMPTVSPPLRASLRNGVWSAWSPVDALPGPFAAVRIPRRDLCVGFTIRSMLIEAADVELAQIALPLDPSTILIVTNLGRLFELTRDGMTTLPTTIATPSPLLAGARDPATGELWFAFKDGRTVHGSLDGTFEEGPAMRSSGFMTLVLAGGDGPDGFELFAATSSRTLERLEGDHFTTVYEDRAADPERSRTRIAWVGPGSAVAIGWGNDRLIEYTDGSVRASSIALDFRLGNPDALYDVADVPPLGGAIAGSRCGLIFVRREGEWRRLPEPPTNGRVFAATSIDHGILFGGQNGVLTQYFEGVGYCEPLPAAPFAIEHLLPLDDGFALIEGGRESARGIEIVILDRR